MIRIKYSDVAWSYLGLLLCSGINLILLPFALRYLTVPELGLWYTFASFQGIAVILDFGFSATLGRNFTYAWSGVESLQKQGVRQSADVRVNRRLFLQLYRISGWLFLCLSALLLVFLLPLGSAYIAAVSPGIPHGLSGWFLYLAAVAVNLYSLRFSPLLKGIGAVKQSQQVQAASKLGQFLFSMLFLLQGWGLIGMAAGYLISSLCSVALSEWMLRRYNGVREILNSRRGVQFSFREQKNLLMALLPNLVRQGAISVSDFLVSRTGILLVSGYLGLEISASFGLLQQVTGMITTMANALYNAYLPLFGEYRLTGDLPCAKRLFFRAIRMQWAVLLCGGAGVLFAGNRALSLIGAAGRLPGWEVSAVSLLSAFLLNNHLLFGSYIMTGNRIPMCRAYLASGAATVFLQWLLLSQTQTGLLGVVCAGGCVQLCYNNWRWVLEVLKELGYFRTGGNYGT